MRTTLRCAVSATDHVDQMANDNGMYLSTNGDGHNSTIIPPDINHNEAAMMNATNATNHTANASTAAHKLPATGNPILALFAVSAILGGASVLRRK